MKRRAARADWPVAVRHLAVLSIVIVVLVAATPRQPAGASAPLGPQPNFVVSAVSTSTYGSVLAVSGRAAARSGMAGAPLYEFSGDAGGDFGCTSRRASGWDVMGGRSGVYSCTGPMTDFINSVPGDDWPALTTTVTPQAGAGVNQKLLGIVGRPGIGRQVTYAGHPLYLFDPPSGSFMPEGEDYFETAAPLLPWRGIWRLVSAKGGQPVAGPATIEAETLPNGKTAVAAEEFPNLIDTVVTVYSFSLDHPGSSACTGACATTWIPVLTTGKPHVTGVAANEIGTVRRRDGTQQVTYGGKPLYLYSAERFVDPTSGAGPLTTGTVGNGNGLAGPDGGIFSVVSPVGD
jgi:predicted lipoprotein with Yx(FWY)xxD motif